MVSCHGTDLLSAGWLFDKCVPLDSSEAALETSALLPGPVYQLPASATGLEPKAPALVVDPAANRLPLATPLTNESLWSAVRDGSNPDDVLVGGEGCDYLMGGVAAGTCEAVVQTAAW